MIRPVSYSEVEPYIEMAKKEGLIFCSKTQYIGLFRGDKLLAMAGMLIYPTRVVMKNDYVLPEQRRKGLHKALMLYRISRFRDRALEATCTPMSLNNYLRFGFKRVKEFKNGCVKVVYEGL